MNQGRILLPPLWPSLERQDTMQHNTTKGVVFIFPLLYIRYILKRRFICCLLYRVYYIFHIYSFRADLVFTLCVNCATITIDLFDTGSIYYSLSIIYMEVIYSWIN